MADEAKTFMVEDARIIFRNFSGAESRYNDQGERNFALILDPGTADVMIKDGWNIKLLNAREEGEEGEHIISVKVNFKNIPPKITLITSIGRTVLKEDTVGILDYADILTCDLICRGYQWEVGDKSGIKAYLQTMFVTIDEDPLERKYAIMEQKERKE